MNLSNTDTVLSPFKFSVINTYFILASYYPNTLNIYSKFIYISRKKYHIQKPEQMILMYLLNYFKELNNILIILFSECYIIKYSI